MESPTSERKYPRRVFIHSMVKSGLSSSPRASATAPSSMRPASAQTAASETWGKLSAPYEGSVVGRPHQDVAELATTLVELAPERMLWTTNWPHPGQVDPPSVSDLATWRDEWIPARHRELVLVHNPATVYEFPIDTSAT